MSQRNNPYVGPSPFEESESHLFFGREDEARELLSLVMAYPATLFYSQSGAGKTSLINARILPMLKAQRAHIFGVVRAGLELSKGVTLNEDKNVFLYNTLLGLKNPEAQPAPEDVDGLSLKDYLKVMPRPDTPKGFYPFQVIVFDQFEEVFTSFPDRWRDQEGFFRSVGEALEVDPLLRVVFVMREEYIASLDPYAAMLPHRLRWRFRLERLRRSAALRAVEGPAEKEGRTFKPGAAEKLVDSLLKVPIKSLDGTVVDTSSEFVEPVHLQVVCERLWDSLGSDVVEIDEDRIARYGDVDEALSGYYDACLRDVAAEGINEGMVRDWFELDLITPIGTRGTVYVDETGVSGLSLPSVQKLEKRRLVRAELRGGATWYELTHDRFIGPIISSNRLWRRKFGKGKVGQVSAADLERRAREWDKDGRPAWSLLSGRELKAVRAWRKVVGVRRETALLRDFIEASASRANRQFIQIALVITVVAVLVAAYGIYSYMAVRDEKARADKVQQLESSRIAGNYARVPGYDYLALALGLEAIGRYPPRELHPEAAEGLRTALTVSGNRVLLRQCVAIPDHINFSADGSLVLAVCSGKLHVWEAGTGRLVYSRPERGLALWRQVDFSPDGSLLYAISYPPRPDAAGLLDQDADETDAEDLRGTLVLILNASSGSPVSFLQDTLQGIFGLRMSGNGQRILGVAFDQPRLRLRERGGGRTDDPLPQERLSGIRQVDLSHDGMHLVVVRRGGDVELWDVSRLGATAEAPLSVFKAGTSLDTDVPSLIKFSPDGNFGMIVSAAPGSNGAVTALWDERSGKSLAPFRSEVGKSVRYASFSADGQKLVIFGNQKAEVRDAATGGILHWRALPAGSVVRFDGTDAFVTREDGGRTTLLRWDALSGEETHLLGPLDAKLKAAAVSPDGSRVAATDENGITQMWEVRDPPDMSALSLAELRERACGKLRYQTEYEQVKVICEQKR